MAEPIPVMKTVFHKAVDADGKTQNVPVEMYAIDAQNAVSRHPKEYSFEPWDGSEGPNQANGELRVIVPTDWIDRRPSEKLALARSLGAENVRSGADAEEFINDYLVERANAAPSGTSERPSIEERPAAEAREVRRAATLEVQEGRSAPEAVKPQQDRVASVAPQDSAKPSQDGSKEHDEVKFAQPAAGKPAAK